MYNKKSDIWALGCILYELCTFMHPFDATNPVALCNNILKEKAENNTNKKYQKKYSGVKSSSNYKNNHPMPHVNKVNSKNENNNIKTPTKPKTETGNAFDTKNKNLSLSYVKQAMEKYYKSKLQQGSQRSKRIKRH